MWLLLLASFAGAVSADADHAINNEFCFDKHPGYFQIGHCLPVYHYCDYKRNPFVYYCRSGYVFAAGKCIQIELLPDCKHKSAEKCINEADGVYPLGPCEQSFVVCKHGKRTDHLCGHNEIFDTKLLACAVSKEKCVDDAAGVTFVGGGFNFCEHKADGGYAITGQSDYIVCEKHKASAGHCAQGMHWDHKTLACITDLPIGHPASIGDVLVKRMDFCWGRPDGLHLLGRCSRDGIYCLGHRAYTLHCNEEFIFTSGDCLHYTQRQDCPKDTAEYTKQRYAKLFCLNKLEGFFSYDQQCRPDYIQCTSDHESLIGYCNHGFAFDPDLGHCLLESECGHSAAESAHEQQKVKQEDCLAALEHQEFCGTEYVTCLNGEVVHEHCNPGYVMDPAEHKCLHHFESSCEQYLPDRICHEGSDGKIYPYPPDCTVFVQCDHGVGHLKHCAPGTAWNPEIYACDHLRNVHC